MKNISSPWMGRALAAGVLSLVATGILAQSSPTMSVISSDAIQWRPSNPERPDGMQIAVLRGDPASGPSSMLMRFGEGVSPMHAHAADYDAVVLEGTVQHWKEGEAQSQAPLLKPGSYWFQPAVERHADACLSETCVLYVQWAGAQ